MATQMSSKSALAINQNNFEIPDVPGRISKFISKVINALSPTAPTNNQVNKASIQHEITKAKASMLLMNVNR